MHLYCDWQRCSHVYGAVGVSFLRHTVLRLIDCICSLSYFLQDILYMYITH